MNTTPASPNPDHRSLSGRFFRWLFSWRSVRSALIVLVGLVTLVAIAWTEEKWRGKHDWELYKKQWEAKGEHFDFSSFAPPPVPDDQNFFKAPIWAGALSRHLETNPRTGELQLRETNVVDQLKMTLSVERGLKEPETGGNWAKGTLTRLQPWQEYYRKAAALTNLFPIPPRPGKPAADVLMALSRYDSAIDALRQAGQRPEARLPLDYEAPRRMIEQLLPLLAELKGCTRVLELRAIAELAAGESAKALQDVQLMLRLNDSIRNEPLLIANLVRMALTSITLQPVYEGLAEHRWSEAQLATLESALAKEDFLADYEFVMRGERAFGITMLGRLTQYHGLNPFYHQWELAGGRMYQRWILPCVDVKARLLSPANVHRLEEDEAHEWARTTPYNVTAKMTYPAVGEVLPKCARAQVSIDLARVGCALERYRLAHGQYPDTLEALTPKLIDPLPHDIINGQPLHYRRTADGRFVLYSIGWNDKDDGGHVVLTHRGSVDWDKGDWVWQYPAAK